MLWNSVGDFKGGIPHSSLNNKLEIWKERSPLLLGGIQRDPEILDQIYEEEWGRINFMNKNKERTSKLSFFIELWNSNFEVLSLSFFNLEEGYHFPVISAKTN